MIHYITTNGVGNAWVGNEIRVLRNAGIPVKLHSLRAPAQTFFTADDILQINAQTELIYPLHWSGQAISILVAPVLFGGRFFTAFANAMFARRESLRTRLKCLVHFFVACDWARKLRSQQVDVIHSQWIHAGGTVGMYAAWLLDVAFGFTGHAADLFRDRSALRDKIKRAEYIVCISYFHRDFYLIYGARPEQLKIVYCGIDVKQFVPRAKPRPQRAKFTLLSSGRLVEKKGFNYLIDACHLLRDRIDFHCVIAGSGELEAALNRQIEQLGLGQYVSLTGRPLLQEEIHQFMHTGDCYCLPCVWASDNDVDGLPQMLMEAMACGLPAISTRLVGIPDLVVDRNTGLLIEPNNAAEIADAVIFLHDDPSTADKLARRGRQAVVERFNLDTCLNPLIDEFNKRLIH